MLDKPKTRINLDCAKKENEELYQVSGIYTQTQAFVKITEVMIYSVVALQNMEALT
jgi:hypothetical protein